jgi:alpha-D-ribose 1-methylphosphonate 5-triphosphate synthase subunit PhnH
MIGSGFADPVHSAQTVFRAVLEAMSRPGTIQAIGAKVTSPQPLSPAMAAVALTLCDQGTPVWLDAALCATPDVAAWLRFHCGTKIVEDAGAASFAFAADPRTLAAFDNFNLGSADYPDRSTTLVLRIDSFATGRVLTLEGPGIKSRQVLRADPLPDNFAERLWQNRELFPRGIDLVLASADEIAALPRSVRLVGCVAAAEDASCAEGASCM